MESSKRFKTLAKDGVFELLQYLHGRLECPINKIQKHFSGTFDTEYLDSILRDLQNLWFLERVGDRIRITEDGSEAYLLFRVIDGAPFESVIDQLTLGMRKKYGLITRDITGAFFQILSDIASPKEILICSPWIRFHENHLKVLSGLMKKTKISAIIRPPIFTGQEDFPSPWIRQITNTLRWSFKNGIKIFVQPRLHTKLYIISADYYPVAIFGSENLTAAGNIELGLKITDSYMIKRLIAYWENILSESRPLEEGELFGR